MNTGVTLPIKDSCLLENIAKVDVSVEEVWIKSDGFLKVMYSQPYFALCIEYTTKIAPGNCKVWSCFDSL